MFLWTWQLQSCARTSCLENLSGVVFTKFMVYFGEEIKILSVWLWVFSPTEFWDYFENFWIGQPTKVKHFRCSTNHFREGFWRYHPGDWGQTGKVDGWVVFSRYRSRRCQDWGLWLLKNNLKNQLTSYNYKTSEVISIYQVNYKAIEKYYATEELVGYSKTSSITVSVSVYNCCLRFDPGHCQFSETYLTQKILYAESTSFS